MKSVHHINGDVNDNRPENIEIVNVDPRNAPFMDNVRAQAAQMSAPFLLSHDPVQMARRIIALEERLRTLTQTVNSGGNP